MFKDHEEDNYSQQEGDTVIGGSIKIEGDLVSQGNIVVEGQVVGSVKTEKHLTVGQQAKLDAEVTAGQANIAGEVNGNINISDKAELTSTAKINGDIKTKILKVEEGAQINGNVQMDGSMNAEQKTEEKEEKPAESDEEDF